MKALYVDVDGTLVGPEGLFHEGTAVADALFRARHGGLDVVPISGRGRVQMFELARLLGLPRAIAELGCVHVEGREVRYEFGAFPFVGETPVEAMQRRGAIDAALHAGLEPFDPWNEGRTATYLLRGTVDVGSTNAALAQAGFDWCELIDNGALWDRVAHAYHLAPTGTGKVFGVEVDRQQHGLARDEVVYVGDAASDLACAPVVGECWLVANADDALDWPHRTAGRYGLGVAELIDRLLDMGR